jgi:hypothetical protein
MICVLHPCACAIGYMYIVPVRLRILVMIQCIHACKQCDVCKAYPCAYATFGSLVLVHSWACATWCVTVQSVPMRLRNLVAWSYRTHELAQHDAWPFQLLSNETFDLMDHVHIMVYICLSSSFTASFWVVIMCDAMSRAGSCLHVVCMALHVVAHVRSRGSAQVRPFNMLMYCAAQRLLYLYSFSLPFYWLICD